MVMSSSKVTDVSYYDQVGAGVEGYYVGGAAMEEPPGRWQGRAAEALGLDGEVDGDEMHDLFGRYVAPDGRQLGTAPYRYRSVEERLAEALEAEPDALPERVREIRHQLESSQRAPTLGWDLTASPSKSVSAVWAALVRAEHESDRAGESDRASAYREIRQAVESALEEASAVAIAELESRALVQLSGGRYLPAAGGLVVASFRQHTSRSIDPQLHVHNVILNKALASDGRWRALDGASILADRLGAGATFERVLAERLGALGLEMATRPDGKAQEILGVPQDVLDLFSGRRRAVTAAMEPLVRAFEERHGREATPHELNRIARAATVQSRAGKIKDGESLEEMADRWHAEAAAEVGQSLGVLADRVLARYRAAQAAPRAAREWSPHDVVSRAVAEVSRKYSVWGRSEVRLEINLALPTLGVSAVEAKDVLDRLTEMATSEPYAVQVAGIEDHEVPVELLDDGSVYTRPQDRKYAAVGTLAAESALRQAAITRGRHSVAAEDVNAWLDQHAPTIGEDQRAAVAGIASSDAALTVLVGPAGTGKSYAAGRLSDVWGALSGGGRVQGLAVSSVAAQVLADDGLGVTANITKWLAAQERIEDGRASEDDLRYAVRREDMILVDEASMVGTEDLTRIRDIVERAGARLVLTGDPRQLGAIEAGGVMGLVDGHAETYTLADVRRMTVEWEREASLRLRDGDVGVLAEYDRRGRIVDAADLPAAMLSAARAAAADILEGRSSMVIAPTNEQAAEVAELVRRHLVAAGAVEESGVDLPNGGGTAGVGDTIMARKNDYGLGVLNRERYIVREVRGDGSLKVAAADGSERVLSRQYVEQYVTSAYASTVHAAQGVTLDTGHAVTDGRTDSAALYVAMSRGRHRNTAHVALSRERDESPAKTSEVVGDGTQARTVAAEDRDEAVSGLAVLCSGLEREAETVAATVAAERDTERRASLSTLIDRIEDGTRIACRARLDEQLDRLAEEGVLAMRHRAALASDQGTEFLARRLRALELEGHDPEAALRKAVAGGKLDSARSVAQVLSYRVRPDGKVRVPAVGVEAVPSGLTAKVADYLGRLHEAVADRARVLGERVAESAPAWAVRAFGAVPAAGTEERVEWERRAGLVAGAREATGYDDEEHALGAAPGESRTEGRAIWYRAWDALGRPDAERETAGMTEGQLRARVAAWERAKAAAPTHVDELLKAAEQTAEDARIGTALSDGQEREQHRERGLRAKVAARVAEGAAKARDRWLRATSKTRAAAEQAAEELQRRGVRVGEEEDRVTAEEYLAADREATLAEDEHREVTEADLLDEEREAAMATGVEERSEGVADAATPIVPLVKGAAHESASTDLEGVDLDQLETRARLVDALLDYQAAVDADEATIPDVDEDAQSDVDEDTWAAYTQTR